MNVTRKMKIKTLKFCKDCRFFNTEINKLLQIRLSLGQVDEYEMNKHAFCTHPQSIRSNNIGEYEEFLVTGENRGVEIEYHYCVNERSPNGKCKEGAILFEPKEV